MKVLLSRFNERRCDCERSPLSAARARYTSSEFLRVYYSPEMLRRSANGVPMIALDAPAFASLSITRNESKAFPSEPITSRELVEFVIYDKLRNCGTDTRDIDDSSDSAVSSGPSEQPPPLTSSSPWRIPILGAYPQLAAQPRHAFVHLFVPAGVRPSIPPISDKASDFLSIRDLPASPPCRVPRDLVASSVQLTWAHGPPLRPSTLCPLAASTRPSEEPQR